MGLLGRISNFNSTISFNPTRPAIYKRGKSTVRNLLDIRNTERLPPIPTPEHREV